MMQREMNRAELLQMQEQIDLALARPLGPRGCHDDPWIGNPREDEVIDAIP